jgi:hypothetical protein
MKIITHRAKSNFLVRAVALPAAEGSKIEAVECAEALEVIPAAAAEATTVQPEKSRLESLKSDQQPKLQIFL